MWRNRRISGSIEAWRRKSAGVAAGNNEKSKIAGGGVAGGEISALVSSIGEKRLAAIINISGGS
jgi:hypothetical protein